MINKKIITSIMGILLVLTLFTGVSAFSYDEDEEGNPFYEADAQIKVPSISIKDLFILQPSSEPSSPELGMIYLDANSKRLNFYDGIDWYEISLKEKDLVEKETKKEKTESEICALSTYCEEWGDCINDYQTKICVTINEDCSESETSESRDCSIENPFQEEIDESKEISKSSDSKGKSSSKEEVETEEEIIDDEEISEEEIVIEEIEAEIVEETPTGEVEEVEPEPSEEAPAEEAIPEELFDITFDLEKSSLSKSDKLVVWVTLQNFGRKYIPARLIYIITDKDGREIYKEFKEIRVYTDESFIHVFEDLVLEDGEYNLELKVEYAGIIEDFKSGFKVKENVILNIKNWFIELFGEK